MRVRDFVGGIPYLGWAVVYTALCWGLFAAILGAVTPELRRELDDYQQLGTLMLAWASGNLLGAVQGGRLAHRHDPRVLFLAYCGGALLALGLIVFSRHFATLMLGFFGIAIFESAGFTVGHGLLAAVYSEPTARARLLSMVDVAYSSGTLLTPVAVIGLQRVSDDWRLPYQLFVLPLAVAFGLFVRRGPFEAHRIRQAAAPAQPGAATPAADGPSGYRALLRQPVVAWATLAGVLSGYVEWGQNFWYVSYAIQAQQLSPNAARLGLQAFVAGMVLARCWQAFVHSRWSLHERLWRLNGVALAGIASAVLWPGHGGFSGYALSNFLLGVGIGVVFPTLLALLIDQFPAQASRLSALLMVSFTLGAQSAGLLIGALSDRYGLHTAYATLLAAALGFTAAVWRLGGHGRDRHKLGAASGRMHG